MDSLEDLLQQKAAHLDVDAKKTELDVLQTEVERFFDSGVRAQKITNDTLILSVKNPSLATDVRYRQVALLDALQSAVPRIKKLRINLF